MLFDVLDVVVTWWRAGGRTCCSRISAQDFCGIPLCLRMVRTSFFHGKNVILSVEEKLLISGGCTVRFDATPMVHWGKWRLLTPCMVHSVIIGGPGMADVVGMFL